MIFGYIYDTPRELAKIEESKDEAPPSLSGKVLIINQSYEPVSICSAKKAMVLLYLTKADLIARRDGKVVHTISKVFPYPSVIRISNYVKLPFKRIELSRKNILKRDSCRCQYCGTKSTELTIDHVIPRSRGGAETWENLVSACMKCNNKKGNQTPEEAAMTLINIPRRPHYILFMKQYLDKVEQSWRPFLFMD